MELPKSKYQPVERDIDGEVVYLDTMMHLGEYTGRFSDLDDYSRAAYYRLAETYADVDYRPAIVDEYEKFDRQMPDIDRSCVKMADELLMHKFKENLPFASIYIDKSPESTVEKIKQTRIGELLRNDDEQLAFESDGSYYPILDIKKKYATLTGVGLSVFGWDDDRRILVDGEDPDDTFERRMIAYPEGEKLKRREFNLSFQYKMPDSYKKSFSETITFTVGETGTSISSQVYVNEYMEMGYDGHDTKFLRNLTDDDVRAMGDMIAELVGEDPISTHERTTQEYKKFLENVTLSESRYYIEEWVDNRWDGQVMADLRHKLKIDSVPLLEALTLPDLAEKAHEELVYYVDHKRHQKNHWARKYKESPIFNEEPPEPWRDGEFRSR